MIVDNVSFDGIVTLYVSQPIKFAIEDVQEAFDELFEITYVPNDLDLTSNFVGWSIVSNDKNFIKLNITFEKVILVDKGDMMYLTIKEVKDSDKRRLHSLHSSLSEMVFIERENHPVGHSFLDHNTKARMLKLYDDDSA